MTSISLCMIVRDEAAHLARALRSAADVADELVVVDTGSKDATLEIARACGAKTATVEWRDDFALARNASIELATSAWCLVLDADEEIADVDARRKLAEFARRAAKRADPASLVGRLTIENLGAQSGATSARISRFFARDEHIRFEGRIHEQLARSSGALERADTGVVVHHHGYCAEQLAVKDKLARNLELLERALRERPNDAYLWFQLGRTEALASRHDRALAALENALAGCGDDASWGIEALETAAYSLRALGRSRQALALLGEVETQFADRADTCFLLGLLAMDTGDLARAERGFERALTLADVAQASESARAASSVAPAYNLGVMREVLGRSDEARAWYQRALAVDPKHAPTRAALARLDAAER